MPNPRHVRIICFALALAGLIAVAVLWLGVVQGLALSAYMLPWPVAFWCCCGTACTIFSDDFNSLSTSGYSVPSGGGSWSASTGSLKTSSSNARITNYSTSTAVGADGVHVTCDVTVANTGDVAKVLFSFDGVTLDDYWYAQVQAGATDGTLNLYQRSSGTNTLKAGPITITGYQAGETVSVCCSAGLGLVKVTAGDAEILYAGSPATAEMLAGWGTGTVVDSVSFDNVRVYTHFFDDPDCSDCARTEGVDCIYCLDGMYSNRYLVRASGWTTDPGEYCDPPPVGIGACTNMNGTFVLEHTGGCAWEYEYNPLVCNTLALEPIKWLRMVIKASGNPSLPYRVELGWATITGAAAPYFQKDYATLLDCLNFDEEEITGFAGGTNHCTFNGDNCFVTRI